LSNEGKSIILVSWFKNSLTPPAPDGVKTNLTLLTCSTVDPILLDLLDCWC